ncbi:tRNA (cytosine(32)/uridine(32)-2'-O)-methyltransferase TrmJ [Niveibacterium umoris]|uniref:tRNA (cytidine/uridine-2'-O-)-methyltransferase TrmJ n=1 Tax=Niveibacterium umoris TaxID=1193620 RepID=A0A840BIY7_9RHOO|nr:RNA methyltransferase [Niveibacterium umoris]MBB4011552.1 tRNA/rRNA methyltransferase [Niveibacterium umoris]
MTEPLALSRIRVVLSRPSHPGNIGAAARAMKTMGLSQLVLVAPKSFPHPEASSRASGATDVLDAARVVNTLEEALEGTVLAAAMTSRIREMCAAPRWASEVAPELLAFSAQGDVAVVFGNETFGLSNEEVMACQRAVTIPANTEYASLNLGAAVQVIAYELRRCALEGRLAPLPQQLGEVATHDDVERLVAHFERAMIESGFLDPEKPRRLMPRLRRLFGRAAVEREEVAILRGMLTSFEAKVDRNTRDS